MNMWPSCSENSKQSNILIGKFEVASYLNNQTNLSPSMLTENLWWDNKEYEKLDLGEKEKQVSSKKIMHLIDRSEDIEFFCKYQKSARNYPKQRPHNGQNCRCSIEYWSLRARFKGL